MQVIIARQLKDLHDGIEHFPVLAGQADDAFDLLAGLQRLDKRRHFDGLRPCAEDGHDFQLIHAVPPVFLPAPARPPTESFFAKISLKPMALTMKIAAMRISALSSPEDVSSTAASPKMPVSI